MSERRAPPRMIEGAAPSEELRRALVAYGGEPPSGAQRARMFSAIERQIGAASSPAATHVTRVAKLKLTLGTSLLCAGLSLLPTDARPRVAAVPLASAPVVEVMRSAPAPVGGAVPWASAPAAIPSASEAVLGPPAAEAAPNAPSTSAPTAARPRALRTPKPSEGAAERAIRAAPPQPIGPEPMSELTLLANARRALLSQPARAFALAEEHARSYPLGTFCEEREVLAIESLLKLDRMSEAVERARAFERRFPSSAHRARLRHLLGAARGSPGERAPPGD